MACIRQGDKLEIKTELVLIFFSAAHVKKGGKENGNEVVFYDHCEGGFLPKLLTRMCTELSLPFESRYLPLRKFLNIYQESLEEPEEFWAEQARQLDWFKTWDKVLEWDPSFARWFVGGRLNASHICGPPCKDVAQK